MTFYFTGGEKKTFHPGFVVLKFLCNVHASWLQVYVTVDVDHVLYLVMPNIPKTVPELIV